MDFTNVREPKTTVLEDTGFSTVLDSMPITLSGATIVSDFILFPLCRMRDIMIVLESRMVLFSDFVSCSRFSTRFSPEMIGFVSILLGGWQTPRRDAKNRSSSLKASPPTREERKVVRREAGQEGIEMEGVEVPASQKYKGNIKEMQKVILRMIEKVPDAWESKEARKGLTAAKRNDCT